MRTETGGRVQNTKIIAWNNMSENGGIKKLKIRSSKKLTSELLSLSRQERKQVIDLLDGHCHLWHHLHRLTVYQSSRQCRDCGDGDEKTEHVLLE